LGFECLKKMNGFFFASSFLSQRMVTCYIMSFIEVHPWSFNLGVHIRGSLFLYFIIYISDDKIIEIMIVFSEFSTNFSLTNCVLFLFYFVDD